ncbi:MAG: HAD-IB family phosphatase [Candidatus Omnitrophica bacterium]|nr:HAD-IB family phosphatase [Candidatus Omnitrophota bacterium]MCM8816353.1 HAD-IB family phosphatase [Candidatus Omnitrophota bacterium]
MEKRKFVAIVFDIDGTIVKPLSSWRYIHERLGNWDVLAYKYQDMFLKGKISYREFCKLDASHWKGLPQHKISKLFKRVPYTKNAKKYLLKLKKMGFCLIALSTGLHYIPDRLKKEIGFKIIVSNRLISRKGILTGGVKINISHGEKGKVLRKILTKLKIHPKQVICVGDSDGDIPMAKICGFSISFNSISSNLNMIVDYVCKGNDFSEVYRVIKHLIEHT